MTRYIQNQAATSVGCMSFDRHLIALPHGGYIPRIVWLASSWLPDEGYLRSVSDQVGSFRVVSSMQMIFLNVTLSWLYKISRRRIAEVDSTQATTQFSCKNNALTRGCPTTPANLMSFPSYLGRECKTRNVSCLHKQLGRQWKISGLRGILAWARFPLAVIYFLVVGTSDFKMISKCKSESQQDMNRPSHRLGTRLHNSVLDRYWDNRAAISQLESMLTSNFASDFLVEFLGHEQTTQG